MDEEAKLEFTITVNWRRKDGSIATTQLGTLGHSTWRSAEDVGSQLADAKLILARLQEIVVSEQLERHCEAVRPCPSCHRRRPTPGFTAGGVTIQFLGGSLWTPHALMVAVIAVKDALPLRYRNCARDGKSQLLRSAGKTRSATSLPSGRCAPGGAVAGNRRSKLCHDT